MFSCEQTDIENLVNNSFRKAKELMAITLKLNYVPAHGMHPFDACYRREQSKHVF